MKVILIRFDKGDGGDPNYYINWDLFGRSPKELSFKKRVEDYLQNYNAWCERMRAITSADEYEISPDFLVNYEDIPEGIFDNAEYVLSPPIKDISEFDEIEIFEE
jgi:hypothetical protein